MEQKPKYIQEIPMAASSLRNAPNFTLLRHTRCPHLGQKG